MLPNLAETAQLKEATAGDTSNMLAVCQLGVHKHTQVTYDGWRPDDVTSNRQVEIDAGEVLKMRAGAEPDDSSLSVV